MPYARVDRALEAALKVEPGCYVALAKRVFSVELHVFKRLKAMHRSGLIHITCWNGRRPVFAWGSGVDAKWVSNAASAAERKRRSRAAMDVASKDFLAARRRQQRRTIKIDALTMAFFWGKP